MEAERARNLPAIQALRNIVLIAEKYPNAQIPTPLVAAIIAGKHALP